MRKYQLSHADQNMILHLQCISLLMQASGGIKYNVDNSAEKQ